MKYFICEAIKKIIFLRVLLTLNAVLYSWVFGVMSVEASPLSIEPKLKSPLGVFYFPGWKNDVLGLPFGERKPWELIKKMPEREPLLGWYPEGEEVIMSQHLKWMSEYKIGFVVFDYYWGANKQVLGHIFEAYNKSNDRKDVPYMLMWANHSRAPLDENDFLEMIRAVLSEHMILPEYLKINKRPIFFIQLPEKLEENAKKFGSSATELIKKSQVIAKKSGFTDGIMFVAGAGARDRLTTGVANNQGYSAYTTYNYHAGPGGRINGELRFSQNYTELDQGYQEHWNWFISDGDLPYIVPMTAGWDKRAWGGSKDPKHDQSVPTEMEFESHIRDGLFAIKNNKEKTMGIGVICCWNEFGEGSVVEPTKKDGLKRLEIIKSLVDK